MESVLQGFASELSCPICGDLFNGAVMFPDCAHTFCSFCVRRALSFKPGQCPSCGKTVGGTASLQPIRLIDNLVEVARSAHKLVTAAGGGASQSAPGSLSSQGSKHTPAKRARLFARDDADGAAPERHLRGPRECCSDCGIEVAGGLERHGPVCLARGEEAQRRFREQGLQKFVGSDVVRPERVAIPAYHEIKRAKLQQLLHDAGLSEKGSRDELVNRHRLWLQHYNSNIDVPHPEPLSNLRAEVAAFERASGPLAKSAREKVPGAQPDWKAMVANIRERKRKQAEDQLQLQQLQQQDNDGVDGEEDLSLSLTPGGVLAIASTPSAAAAQVDDGDAAPAAMPPPPLQLSSPPAAVAAPVAAQPQPQPQRRSAWQAVWSDAAQRPFYFNGDTLVGTFERPADFVGQ